MQDSIAHSIQLAVAPVFMLTAIAAMIGALANRLARIIDRGRILEERIAALPDGEVLPHAEEVQRELTRLRQRGRVVNLAMIMQTLAATLIAATVITLFLGETTEMQIFRLATVFFLSGVIFFLLALVCFLAETLLATRMLKFGRPKDPGAT